MQVAAPSPAGAHLHGGQKQRQEGRPEQRVHRVDLGALHTQQQGFSYGVLLGHLRGANSIQCRLPCSWKEFGAECKYKFESWRACDGGTGTKARQGTLKKARYNAQCQETIRVTKPCTPKTKAKAKGQCGDWGVKTALESTVDKPEALGPHQ